MNKKYQVFVSSTFRDLFDERQDTIRSILDLGHVPAGMELFPATDVEQLSYIKKVIDECDYYILIIGGRYGSLDADGISFTEREYDYAVETGKIVLAFVHGDAASIPVGKVDTATRLVKNLSEFRDKVMSGRLVRQWVSRENLEAQVVKSVARATNDFPMPGWIRGDAAASEELLQQNNTLRVENDKLRKEITSLKAEINPKLSNLADLDEEIELTFTYQETRNGLTRTINENIEFTWSDIFKIIAVRISVPKVSTLIGHYINEHIQSMRGSKKHRSLSDEQNAMVKNQLVALSLIETTVAQSENGKVYEWMTLTRRGTKQLSETLAVKSQKQI